MVALVTLAACASEADRSPIETAAPEGQQRSQGGEALACDTLVGNGMKDTNKVVDDLDQRCTDEDGELISVTTESFTCADGATLYVNDLGYGYDNSAWRPASRYTFTDSEVDACTEQTTTTTAPPTTTTTTAPPTTTTTAPPSVLVYEVGGSGSALVTYMIAGFSQEQHEVTLPWRHEIPEAEAPEIPTLVAQLQGSGEITCRISWSAGTAPVAEAASSGDYVVVTCG
jgi:hypothetical protein